MISRIVGFYKDKKKRTRPITSKKTNTKGRSIFFPPKYEKYSEIVKMDTVNNATKSCRELLDEYKKAETDAKRRRIERVTLLAANRARAMSKNDRISPKEKLEFSAIADQYESTYWTMRDIAERIEKK